MRDSYTNQYVSGVNVASTKETIPMVLQTNHGDIYYKYYPKITEEDIETDTSNKFIDTFNMSNLYLEGIGGDYDGDTITCRGLYTDEANEEAAENINSKQNFINFGCAPVRMSTGDAITSLYALTKVLSDVNLTKNIEFK